MITATWCEKRALIVGIPRRSTEWSTESSCTRVARWISSTTAASVTVRASSAPDARWLSSSRVGRNSFPFIRSRCSLTRAMMGKSAAMMRRSFSATSSSSPATGRWISPSETGASCWLTSFRLGERLGPLADVFEPDVHREHAAVQLSRLGFFPLFFERTTQPVQHAEPLLIARRREFQPAAQNRLRHDVRTLIEEAHAQGFRRPELRLRRPQRLLQLGDRLVQQPHHLEPDPEIVVRLEVRLVDVLIDALFEPGEHLLEVLLFVPGRLLVRDLHASVARRRFFLQNHGAQVDEIALRRRFVAHLHLRILRRRPLLTRGGRRLRRRRRRGTASPRYASTSIPLSPDLNAYSTCFCRCRTLLGSCRRISSPRCCACGRLPRFSKPAVAWSSSSIPRSRSPASISASPSARCASGSSGSSATRASSWSMVGGAGVASMSVNTRDGGASAELTTPSNPRSMKAERRVSDTDVSSSVWMNPPVGGMSSTASGCSSTSWAASVLAVSKSGSSSSGGTSTTAFRLRRSGPGAGAGGGAATPGRPPPGGAPGAVGVPGRLGTTGVTLGGVALGGGVTAGKLARFGGAGGGTGLGVCSISISCSSIGSSSTSRSVSSAPAGTVGSSSAIGCTGSGATSSRSDGTSPAPSRSTCPNSALVVSNPSSSAAPPFPSPPGTSTSSARLVDSISSELSGSGVTDSTRLCASVSTSGSGSGSGKGAGRGGDAGAGGAARPPRAPGGASTSRNTRPDVFRFPDFARSSSGAWGGAAGAAARLDGRRSASPYIWRCSSSIPRSWLFSGEMSVNSLSAANACWIFPIFCMRSAYSTKFCFASAMKPFAAYSLASFR